MFIRNNFYIVLKIYWWDEDFCCIYRLLWVEYIVVHWGHMSDIQNQTRLDNTLRTFSVLLSQGLDLWCFFVSSITFFETKNFVFNRPREGPESHPWVLSLVGKTSNLSLVPKKPCWSELSEWMWQFMSKLYGLVFRWLFVSTNGNKMQFLGVVGFKSTT